MTSISEAFTNNDVLRNVPLAVEDQSDYALLRAKYSFLAGLAVFIVFLPFLRSRKSFCDALAAKKVVRVLRFFIFTSCICMSILLYCVCIYGSPIRLHMLTAYSDMGYQSSDTSWLFGYGRPAAVILFTGMGMVAEMYPLARLFCIMGCCAEIISGTLSSVQVYAYVVQMMKAQAPPQGMYNRQLILFYFWRDIASIGLSTISLFFALLLTCMVGICNPPYITYHQINGGELDRYKTFRESMRFRELNVDADAHENDMSRDKQKRDLKAQDDNV